MKRICTLFASILIAATVFAADRSPSVTIHNSRNYEIYVDGRSVSGRHNTIRMGDMYGGRHTIEVYEWKRGLFTRHKRRVDVSSFRLKRDDVIIYVGHDGRISIREERGNGRYDDRWKNHKGRGRKDDRRYDDDDDHDYGDRHRRY